MTTAGRAERLAEWFSRVMPQHARAGAGDPAVPELVPVSGDASFRRYYRVRHDTGSCILMDAPPDKESCAPFANLARRFLAAGVRVPEIHALDLEQGFMCLADFGDTLLLEKLEEARGDAGAVLSADALYQQAFEQLIMLQAIPVDDMPGLPPFDDEMLWREMSLFRDWFCTRLLGLELRAGEHRMLEQVFQWLIDAANRQDRVCVHRDYHSRNLMVLGEGDIGVLDFQDAVVGPLSYDLVSLLKDCYIAWPSDQVNTWVERYLDMAASKGVLPPGARESFLEDFDLMGVQRHLKAIGIFARLWLRDGKPGYLPDIPRTLDYILAVAGEHEALLDFSAWLRAEVLPVADDILSARTRP